MFKLEFDTDNAAFDGSSFRHEVCRILRHIAREVDAGFDGLPIHDTNGNRIGSWSLEPNPSLFSEVKP